MAGLDTFEDILDRVEPRIARAFDEAMAEIRSVADIRAIERAIAAGDVEAVMAALDLDPALLNPLAQAIEEAYLLGAQFQAGLFPPNRLGVTVRFDRYNEGAVRDIREHGAAFVREFLLEQNQTIREGVQDIVADAVMGGRGPRDAALDIVGRVDGNRRKGGILGLTPAQRGWVENARLELLGLRGEPGDYFGRDRRDKRFDKAIRARLKKGEDIPPDLVNRAIARYTIRMEQMRGEAIARTESLNAANAGRYESVRQMVEKLGARPEEITLIWDATPSDRTRRTHAALNGERTPFGTPFLSSRTGARMHHPGDRSLGAPPEEIINCRCSLRVETDYAAIATRRAREGRG